MRIFWFGYACHLECVSSIIYSMCAPDLVSFTPEKRLGEPPSEADPEAQGAPCPASTCEGQGCVKMFGQEKAREAAENASQLRAEPKQTDASVPRPSAYTPKPTDGPMIQPVPCPTISSHPCFSPTAHPISASPRPSARSKPQTNFPQRPLTGLLASVPAPFSGAAARRIFKKETRAGPCPAENPPTAEHSIWNKI